MCRLARLERPFFFSPFFFKKLNIHQTRSPPHNGIVHEFLLRRDLEKTP
jgi:hypothetical protein